MKTAAVALALVGTLGALPAGRGAEAPPPDDTRVLHVTARRDLRRCASPLCGGYFVHELNQTSGERYVSGLDFSSSGVPDAMVTSALDALADLVLKGQLGPTEPTFGTRALRVTDLYRGLPGVTAGQADEFFTVQASDPPIRCFVAPCNNEVATRLNASSTFRFTTLSVEGMAIPWIDRAWLTAEIHGRGAVVAGHLEKGDHLPGGYEEVLDVSRVYLHLRDPAATACPPHARVACVRGKVATYRRTEDRCLVFDACVDPGICPDYVPVCADGYTLASWASAPAGCPAHACDPAFEAP
jgi:hypothetical protein